MKLRTVLILIAMAALASQGAAAECMRANEGEEIAEGTLSQGTFEDAAGRPEQAYILTLPVPACLSGSDPELDVVESTTTIHIFSSDDEVARSIESLVGKSVRVRGTPFGAHTAHHHAPIVMEVGEIDQILPPS